MGRQHDSGRGNHKPEAQTLKEITDAGKRIKIGGIYQHYKSPDMLYKIISFATLEATDEMCVVYQAQYGAGIQVVRPVGVFLETVEWEGRTVPRFKLVKSPPN